MVSPALLDLTTLKVNGEKAHIFPFVAMCSVCDSFSFAIHCSSMKTDRSRGIERNKSCVFRRSAPFSAQFSPHNPIKLCSALAMPTRVFFCDLLRSSGKNTYAGEHQNLVTMQQKCPSSLTNRNGSCFEIIFSPRELPIYHGKDKEVLTCC